MTDLTRLSAAELAEGLEARDFSSVEAMEHVWPLIEDGQVRPIVHTTLPLAQAGEAHRLVDASEHIGKVVLTTGAAG